MPSEHTPAPWGLALLLLAANSMSFVDRMLLTLMVGPIRAELGISDTAISLLHGLAFASFYAIAGLPLGRLADTWHRPRLMALGVTLWSAMTSSCGFASNFAMMFAARTGVAVGEASLSPAAISLLSERFPKTMAARAIAVFQSGIFVGTALAMLGGGLLFAWFEDNSSLPPLVSLSPWRWVFIAVGAPGLIVAIALLFVGEPRSTATATPSPISFGATMSHIFSHARLYGGHFLAFTAITILAYGSISWMATVLVRAHDLATPDAGFLLGSALLIAGPLGVLCSGALLDILAKREVAAGPMFAALVSVVLLAVAVPIYALAPDIDSARLAALGLAFAQSFPYGVASASLAMVAPPALRGQIIALYLMISNLVGLTFGPLLVALMTDSYFHDDDAIGQSLALLPLLTTPVAIAGVLLCWGPYRRVNASKPMST
ncbi:MAG: MFS transporter [Hyphomonadaceae bacterium]|nr:MFS transporter [Hyphomonadaceae bacterium]